MRIEQFISGAAVDSVTDVLLLVALDGAILDANAAALDCYGYTYPEILALSISDIQTSRVVDGADSPAARQDAEPGARYVAEHRRSDGTRFPVEVREAAVTVDGEHALLGSICDITDRKRVEDTLRERDAKHYAMIANIADVIGIMGVDGVMKYKSPSIEKWFGWRPEDLIGTDGWLTVHPDDRERLQAEFYRILQEDRASTAVEYRYLCKDGSYAWIELTATNLVNDPIIDGVLLNYRDISERRQIERLGKELDSIIDLIGSVSEMRDPYTAGHQRRVSELAHAIAIDIGMPDVDVEDTRVAGLMHDIGKMSVPIEILSKPTQLSPAELRLIQGHSEAGFSIIESARVMRPIAELVHQHHERCDGSGYPRGLVANDLLAGSMVLMVADVVEAMTSHRPYRAALGQGAALAEIERGAGSIYEPSVAESCVRVFRERAFAFSDA